MLAVGPHGGHGQYCAFGEWERNVTIWLVSWTLGGQVLVLALDNEGSSNCDGS